MIVRLDKEHPAVVLSEDLERRQPGQRLDQVGQIGAIGVASLAPTFAPGWSVCGGRLPRAPLALLRSASLLVGAHSMEFSCSVTKEPKTSCSCSSAIPVSLKFEMHETDLRPDLRKHCTLDGMLSGGLDGSSAVFTRGPWGVELGGQTASR